MDWSVEKLEKFHGEFAAAAKNLDTVSEKMALVDRAVGELNAIVKDLQKPAPVVHQSEGERAVVRAYVADPSSVERSALGHVATRHTPIMARQGVGAVRMYGGFSKAGRWVPGLLDDAPKSDWQAEAQELAEQVSVVRALGRHPIKSGAAFREHMAAGPAEIAKMFADNSGEGAELLPDITMPVLQRESEMARVLEANFSVRNVGPGGGHISPFLDSDSGQMFMDGIPAAGELNPGEKRKSALNFSERQYAIPTLTGVVQCDVNAEEDAIIEWLPIARLRMVETERDAVEDAIINGDTAATHQDTALASWTAGGRWQIVGAPNDHRKAFRGLRACAIDASNTTDGSSLQTAAGLMGHVSRLDVAQAFGSVAHLTSPKFHLARLALDPNLLTVDKMGPMATLLRGTVGAVGGRPVLVSQFAPDDLAASGLYTGSGATGCALTFNRDRFEIVQRRGLRIDVESQLRSGVRYLVVSTRKLFRSIDATATKNVHYAYNLSTTP